MKKVKLILMAVAVIAVVGGSLAFKTAFGQGNLFTCSGSTCVAAPTFSDVQGTTTTQPITHYFKALGAGTCSSATNGCNNVHPIKVLLTGQ